MWYTARLLPDVFIPLSLGESQRWCLDFTGSEDEKQLWILTGVVADETNRLFKSKTIFVFISL